MQKNSERRKSVRVPIDAVCFITVRNELTGVEMTALLVDCGCGGAQLNAPPEERDIRHWLGARVMLLGMPGVLDPSGQGIKGTVCWLSEAHCGVRFEEALQLSETQLHDFAQSL